jgi:predicted ThiF/HesA family dinucleotide-utilizing enzyme
MIRLAKLAILASGAVAFAATGATDTARLPADQLAKAARSDSISIPTPGELFAALAKSEKINWSGQYRGPMPVTYRNRAQIALNLGGLIADGFIAVEAKDGQQVKNIGSDIIKLAKSLGVSEHLLGRGKSINEFAENNEWDTLQEELEATQNEVKSSMQSHADQDLVILVTLGGWIRGTQVVTAAIMQNYDERGAKVLRQPALVGFMQSKIDEISPELRQEPLVKNVSEQLKGIEKLVSFPAAKTPAVEEVRKVNEAIGKMMMEIESKELPR